MPGTSRNEANNGPRQNTAPVDVLFTGGQVLNVFTGKLGETPLAVAGGRVISHEILPARNVVDLKGAVVTPGLIDVHIHLESTMLSPGEVARAMVPRGITALAADPHEIANVHGLDGIRWMLEASEDLPLDIRYWLPSCVPACPLDTSGAELTYEDLETLAGHPRICGLGEMMNVPGVIHGDPGVHAKLEMARRHHLPIDGHAPGVSGLELDRYIAAGIEADHESTSLWEALEKLGKGMRVLIREGSAARNLADLLPLVNRSTWPAVSFVTDDRHADDLLDQGAVDDVVRRAIGLGLDPVLAVTLASLTAAQRMRWPDRGHLGIGAKADLVVLDSLERFEVKEVWVAGEKVAEKGSMLSDVPPPPSLPPSMHLGTVNAERFRIADAGGEARIIGIVQGQLLTQALRMRPRVEAGNVIADPERDLAKLAVLERHTGSGRTGLGLVQGLGLKRGAIASSVAHDSHNLIVAGMKDGDMAAAANAVIEAGGGLAAALNGKVVGLLPLPFAGLMSDRPAEVVASKLKALKHQVSKLGMTGDPFMPLSFLALPVIPHLKLTDRGLVDVDAFTHVTLFG